MNLLLSCLLQCESGKPNRTYPIIGFLFLLPFFALPPLYGFDLRITEAELGLAYRPEYTRVFTYSWDMSCFGSLELNDRLTFKSGLALGQVGSVFALYTFASSAFALPIPVVPLYVKVAYIYNGIPDYTTHIHTLLPTIELKGKWAGIAVGPSMRFTVFNQDPPVFEPIIALSGFVHVFYTEQLRIAITSGNYRDFVSGNMGSYSIGLTSQGNITKRLSLINELEILQTGSVGLVANIYGVVYKGGVVLHW
ncbi:MAG: hypothetical protein LBF75_09465 [Treponema sp.]|jgi:hypothetical protein|nr:hypothetical protein [Treponema sp.]